MVIFVRVCHLLLLGRLALPCLLALVQLDLDFALLLQYVVRTQASDELAYLAEAFPKRSHRNSGTSALGMPGSKEWSSVSVTKEVDLQQQELEKHSSQPRRQFCVGPVALARHSLF